ncbi:170aa long hypothetical protein [Pyrococcus horikoshii OT3]|uniref:Uncharacterized protein n=1 Tax=Pyrococcus horikoshii (strain ATCC 700860 / DSM 12428 / JCM 9974 / NBRC 100139 / OT-3) TaxID=70601 RepID=O58436_PYRHO|nr:170aa long hypothetical protein [Pyrococcus horikoshii OT3]
MLTPKTPAGYRRSIASFFTSSVLLISLPSITLTLLPNSLVRYFIFFPPFPITMGTSPSPTIRTTRSPASTAFLNSMSASPSSLYNILEILTSSSVIIPSSSFFSSAGHRIPSVFRQTSQIGAFMFSPPTPRIKMKAKTTTQRALKNLSFQLNNQRLEKKDEESIKTYPLS